MSKNIFLAIAICFAFVISSCEEKKASKKVQQENLSKVQEKSAAPTATSSTAKIEFASVDHDFGTINEGDVVNHTFVFKNTGSSPLIVTEAKPSCGCTVPDYTREPIAPGAEGKVDVQFNSTRNINQQNKSITVSTNSAQGPVTLKFKAFVNPKNPQPTGK